MRILSFFLICCLLGLVALPAFAANPVSDDLLYDKVRLKLANDPYVKGGTFEVTVNDGIVTIRGKVEKEKIKQKAEKVVKKVHGVKGVVNELKIAPIR